MKIRILLILTGALMSLSVFAGDHWKLPENELKMLNRMLADSKKYDHDKQTYIDGIKENLRKAAVADNREKQFELLMTLSRVYRTITPDSAYSYAVKAKNLAELMRSPDKKILSSLAAVSALATEGLFSAVLPVYDSIGHLKLDKELKIEYWKTGRSLYSYMRSYAEGNSIYYDEYSQKYVECDDSLLNCLSHEDNLYKFIYAERLVGLGKSNAALEVLVPLVEELPTKDNLYGMATFQLATVYKQQGDQTKYAAYLAKSAASDIEGCVKEGIALASLANWLYEQGELNDAFRYINYALENARSGNARMRSVMIASVVPHIDEAYREKISSSRDEMMIYVVLVTLLLAATLSLLLMNIKQTRKAKENQNKLANMAKLQNSYIGSFIGMCSNYSERLDSLVKLVNRKLSAGQHAELLKIIKSGKYTEGNDENFYEFVDKAFLDIYPSFVDSINMLLREDEKIELKDPGTLTPELRIYAFVKLGVTESTRIARILQYSVNTVYAYRNKMRNKAIDRERFDEDVAEIHR